MLADMFNYYTSHILWLLPVTIAVLVSISLLWVKFTNDLLWTDIWVIFPLFGKMHNWIQDTHGIGDRATWENNKMPRPESQLCATYLDRKKDPTASEQDFERAKEYLKLTHQADITPTSAWMWALLVILTVAEAAGTGMLIAPFVASEITGNQMIWIGYVIALVMAAGLLGLTHFAGAQAHKFGTVRNHIGKVGRAHDDLVTEPVTCGDDQNIDKNIQGKDHAQLAKIRYANRVLEGAHDRGTLAWVFVVVVVLVALLSGVTWMRIEGIRTQLTRQSAEQVSDASYSGSNPFASIPGMDGIKTVPSIVSGSSQSARKHVQSELLQEQFSQGIAGAVVLALIYLITQGLGFLHSLKHSFVGSGRRAYDLTRGETSYKTYESKYIMPVINTAQKRLEYLRTRLTENGDYRKQPSTMSCYDYFRYQQELRQDRSRYAASNLQPPLQAATGQEVIAELSEDETIHEANKILAEKDAEMRKKLLDYAADGSEQKRQKLLEAIKVIKEEKKRQEHEAQNRNEIARLEEELLGD